MAFLFRSKKSASDVLKSTQKGLDTLVDVVREHKDDEKSIKSASEKLSSCLSQIKFMLYGDGEKEPVASDVSKLCEAHLSSNLLLRYLEHIERLEFEARKDVAQIYNYLLRQRKDKAIPYITEHPQILAMLVSGYDNPEIALNSGSILRECIRHSSLTEIILNNDELFNRFFYFVELPTFDVASDAFATFKLLLTKHKPVAAKFLENRYSDMFSKYNKLLESKNYVTKRQSLKLLGELLLDRSNFRTMMRYINEPDNLKIMMNLLRGTTRAIQFEAFHVFKIFVANPQKAAPIVEILLRNRDKLMEFLSKFQVDKDDEQFSEEKKILLVALKKLQPPAASTSTSASASSAAQ
jgi:calcium binding protein 39